MIRPIRSPAGLLLALADLSLQPLRPCPSQRHISSTRRTPPSPGIRRTRPAPRRTARQARARRVPRRSASAAEQPGPPGGPIEGEEGDAAPDNGTPVAWPLLRRKPAVDLTPYKVHLPPPPPPPTIIPPRGLRQHSSNANRLMLIVDGLSPNLNASDFYRLGPSGLADWSGVIRKVQQTRDPTTLEPRGQYYLTFDSADAAVTYRDKLSRLHQLGRFRLTSPSGLWESNVPPPLLAGLVSSSSTSSSSSDLVRLVDSFTIAPPSLSPIHLQRKRVAVPNPWAQTLSNIVSPLGFGAEPPLLILDVYPPTLSATDLSHFIRTDAHARGLGWQVSVPQHLDARARNARESNPRFEYKDYDTLDKLKRRFVLACTSDSEAHRFHRCWNKRSLTTSKDRFMVHASIVKW